MSAPVTIADALIAAATSGRGIRAIEHDGRSTLLPYKTLLAESLQIGGSLRARGLATGDRVALIIAEVNDFIRVFFGISMAGLVPVPLCPPAQAGDLRRSADLPPRREICRPSPGSRATFSTPAARARS